jgi:galactose oxidase
LSFAHASPTSLNVVGPANANIAPPGHYMLFLISGKGVPSLGQIVRVGN